MLLADLLWLILSVAVVRAVWRVIDGVMEGMSGQSPRSEPRPRTAQSVQMVRDPVCGTYIVPTNALVLTDASRQVFFCSTTCRDKYRARTA